LGVSPLGRTIGCLPEPEGAGDRVLDTGFACYAKGWEDLRPGEDDKGTPATGGASLSAGLWRELGPDEGIRLQAGPTGQQQDLVVRLRDAGNDGATQRA
jgi:hypothetical protein